MAAQKILTGVLLLFVAAGVATVAVKEARRSRAIRTAATTTAGNAPATSPKPVTAIPAEGPDSDDRGIPPTPAGQAPGGSTRPGAPSPNPAAVPASGRKIVVTYFLTTTRCFSCYKIETLSESAVQNTFVGPLKEGRLEWRTINTDEPKNAHYLKDYKLFTKSVIVSEVVDGREVRWKNCEKVWDLLDDPKAFEAYIVREVKAYLGEG